MTRSRFPLRRSRRVGPAVPRSWLVAGLAGLMAVLPAGASGRDEAEGGSPGDPWAAVAEAVRAQLMPGGGPPEIRVGLRVGVPEVEVGCFGGGIEVSGNGMTTLEPGTTVWVGVASEGLVMRDREGGPLGRPAKRLEFRAVPDRGHLMVDGELYRGRLTVTEGEEGGLTVVDVLSLEDYLRGVVGSEIGFLEGGGFAAVQVQAIVSRTYALTQMTRHRERAFDVFADVRDQVYGGKRVEDPRVDRAVASTRGRALLDTAGPARAYYHSTCGGHTSDIRRMWPDREPRSYLTGIRDVGGGHRALCSWSKYFRWVEVWSARDLGEILRRTLPEELDLEPGTDVGLLRGLEVLERSFSGRVTALRIETTEGSFVVRGDRIRWVLRPASRPREILRSTLFKLEAQADGAGQLVAVRIRGGGWGHGVGLCQVGAITLSRLGVRPERILRYYYPGTRVEKLY
jgi:stage II sporulation protein D